MDVSSIASNTLASTNRQNAGGSAGLGTTAPIAPATSSQSSSSTAIDAQNTPTSDHLAQAVDRVNASFAQQGSNLHGTVDKDKISGVYVFKIMDTQTQEVIRQLPPKEVVAFAQSLEQPQGLRRGLLIQEKS